MRPLCKCIIFFFFFLETVHSIALLSQFLFVLGSTSRLWVLSQKRILSTLTIALLTNCKSHSSDSWNINFFERWEWIWRSVSGIDGCSARLHSLWTIQQCLVSTSRNASWCRAWCSWDIIYLGQLRWRYNFFDFCAIKELRMFCRYFVRLMSDY